MNRFRPLFRASAVALSALICVASFEAPSSASDAIANAFHSKTSERWVTPLAAPIQVVNQFRQPSSDYFAGHRGVDYRVQLGQSILSPTDASIYFRGRVVNRQVITLRNSQGLLLEFEPACSKLSTGTDLAAGKAFAVVCEPLADYVQHCSKLRCLHFSVRREQRYISPLALIGGLNPSRLLPYRESASN
ncbi:MAG: hypothetical protein RLZZ229_765 [Actinomycetota bacterium]|jgi:hypothetical protein